MRTIGADTWKEHVRCERLLERLPRRDTAHNYEAATNRLRTLAAFYPVFNHKNFINKLMNGDESSTSFGTDGFQMMGMINALKTGDVLTDMLIAMCFPFVLKMFFGWFDLLDWQMWADWWWKGQSPEHERFISHSTTRNCWGGLSNADEDTQNSVLLKAIKMYLHQVVKLKLLSAYLDLTGMEDKNSHGYYDNDYDSDSDDEDEEYGSRKTLVGMLSRYKIINRLPNNEWHNLGMFGKDPPSIVLMRIEHQSRKEGDENKKERSVEINNTTFHFTALEDGAIDAFINTAYQWYIGELRKLEDNSRYLYEMKVPEMKIGRSSNDDDDGGSGGTTYKRYKLSDEKSFDSLFFREKKSLLGLIDHFGAKTGKYAIKGYPHKLGVLLHGPPGTGKTSLIKALAHYTGRSIVNVPLSRVSTNSELMSIFFDRKYHVEGGYVPVKLGFKDIIFVMEDVDAASKVVKRRDGLTTSDVVEPESIHLPTPKSLFRMFLESTNSDCKDLVKELTEKSERLKKEAEAQKSEVLRAIAQRLTCHPALGLVGASGDDPTIARVCAQAMESATEQKDQYSKLDEILSSQAQAIKALLESGTKVDDKLIDEFLGEAHSFSGRPLSMNIFSKPSGDESSSGFGGESSDMPRTSDFASFPSNTIDTPTNTSKGTSPFIGFEKSLFKPNPDQLSLSGLLNVLDGVVDTPGRILIMTTNHPEMLDPALIRPGRVDKKIMLGFMASTDVVCMLEHYFQITLNDKEVARVAAAIDGDAGEPKYRLKMTPAQIEQLAAEHDELEGIIDAFEKMGPKRKGRFISKTHSTVSRRA
jgi:chaperone BCS1